MNHRVLVSVIAAVSLAGCAAHNDMADMNMSPGSPAATRPVMPPVQAVDLRNAVCPVSGDTVGNSNLVEVYDGKIYHLCCADCHNDFEKDPAKFAKAVAADPGKYGVKQ